MKIAVVGGGGVGGYVAAKLSRQCPLDLISASLSRLRVKEQGQIIIYDLPIYPTPPKGAIYDVVIFATKSFVLEEAAKKMLSHVNDKTIILPLLNGIEPYERLREIFSSSKVIKGAIYIISNRFGDIIELKGKGAMVVMEDCGPKCQELAKCFENSGIKTKLPKDIDRAIWQKYLFIAATAALTTLYDATFGQISNEHIEEFEALLDEIIEVAKSQGVHLKEEDKTRAIGLLKKSPADAKTSMQLDFEKGDRSELENLIGYLANKSALFRQIYQSLKECQKQLR